jgi:hypothetical protein
MHVYIALASGSRSTKAKQKKTWLYRMFGKKKKNRVYIVCKVKENPPALTPFCCYSNSNNNYNNDSSGNNREKKKKNGKKEKACTTPNRIWLQI